jgi:hypothetical protein
MGGWVVVRLRRALTTKKGGTGGCGRCDSLPLRFAKVVGRRRSRKRLGGKVLKQRVERCITVVDVADNIYKYNMKRRQVGGLGRTILTAYEVSRAAPTLEKNNPSSCVKLG